MASYPQRPIIWDGVLRPTQTDRETDGKESQNGDLTETGKDLRNPCGPCPSHNRTNVYITFGSQDLLGHSLCPFRKVAKKPCWRLATNGKIWELHISLKGNRDRLQVQVKARGNTRGVTSSLATGAPSWWLLSHSVSTMYGKSEHGKELCEAEKMKSLEIFAVRS